MAIADKPFDSLAETDLQELLNGQEREGKVLEFKETQPGNSDADRKEFLADVSSFSNTLGGHLIFGVKESAGVATQICGIAGDADAEIRRLEGMLRDATQPRVTGYSVKPIPLQNGRVAIIFRISRSWALPHRVTLGGHDKFYARNSTGKYPLEVQELRSLFALSETTAERIRAFRADRLAQIGADETPVPLLNSPKTVLHLVPLSAFSLGLNLNVSSLEADLRRIPPIHTSGGWSHRHNFDGIVTFSARRNVDESISYLQIFRNGSIEAVDASLILMANGRPTIEGVAWEKALLDVLPTYLQVQRDLGVQFPVLAMLSLLGVKGCYMYVHGYGFGIGNEDPIDRDRIIVPEILVENFTDNPAQVLKPAFDAVWNAAGFAGSIHYDKHGQRRQEPS